MPVYLPTFGKVQVSSSGVQAEHSMIDVLAGVSVALHNLTAITTATSSLPSETKIKINNTEYSMTDRVTTFAPNGNKLNELTLFDLVALMNTLGIEQVYTDLQSQISGAEARAAKAEEELGQVNSTLWASESHSKMYDWMGGPSVVGSSSELDCPASGSQGNSDVGLDPCNRVSSWLEDNPTAELACEVVRNLTAVQTRADVAEKRADVAETRAAEAAFHIRRLEEAVLSPDSSSHFYTSMVDYYEVIGSALGNCEPASALQILQNQDSLIKVGNPVGKYIARADVAEKRAAKAEERADVAEKRAAKAEERADVAAFHIRRLEEAVLSPDSSSPFYTSMVDYYEVTGSALGNCEPASALEDLQHNLNKSSLVKVGNAVGKYIARAAKAEERAKSTEIELAQLKVEFAKLKEQLAQARSDV